ncbi:POU domain, class 5, transcription factor 3-like [Mustela erminea]|uniref:POU domain, class 5, transcription factor 3-like n=1 Tax=Mustela erminea TaxID=36723 RepID=UPI001386A977|nr:POU domain, class 5, transcription factor 3-like [Mustela erminea]
MALGLHRCGHSRRNCPWEPAARDPVDPSLPCLEDGCGGGGAPGPGTAQPAGPPYRTVCLAPRRPGDWSGPQPRLCSRPPPPPPPPGHSELPTHLPLRPAQLSPRRASTLKASSHQPIRAGIGRSDSALELHPSSTRAGRRSSSTDTELVTVAKTCPRHAVLRGHGKSAAVARADPGFPLGHKQC